jgi:hypothetical protein
MRPAFFDGVNSMRCTRWAIHAWPGLAELWQRGSWLGLALALGFTVLVNLVAISSFVWTEWLSSWTHSLVWGALLTTWVASAAISLRQGRNSRPGAVIALQDLFQQAQSEYLKGNWFEAETALNTLLRKDARDIDAHLMLATLLRHTQRAEQAAMQLGRLELLEGAEKWSMEIDCERRHLASLAGESDPSDVSEERGNGGEQEGSREIEGGAEAELLQRAA